MEERYLTAQEVAELLKVKKATVYELLKKGELPGVKVGKQFRVRESDVRARLCSAAPLAPVDDTDTRFVLCGQDTLLDLLADTANRLLPEPVICRSHLGSYNGLVAMYRGQADAATAHLWDRESDSYNLPFVTRLLPGEDVAVYHLVRRPVGFYVPAGNPKQIGSLRDLARVDVTTVSRERGSGIRVLTDSLLHQAGLSPERIRGYEREVGTHLEAAAAVAAGEADCAIGNQKAARQTEGVDFVFLRWEQYDLILRTRSLPQPAGQALLQAMQAPGFRAALDAMGGYDTTNLGERLL